MVGDYKPGPSNGHYTTYSALGRDSVDLKKLRVEGGRMNHALERPIDHKKLRVEGGNSHAFQRPQLTLRASGWAEGGHQIFSPAIHSKDPVKYFIFIRIAFG